MVTEGTIEDGKLARAIGTAALGGALMFGGHNNAMAQQNNGYPQTQQAISMPAQQSNSNTFDVGEYSDTLKRVQADTTKLQQKVQEEKLADRLSREVKGKYDYVYGQWISAEYELIYQSNVDAKTMYDRLMTCLYNQDGVSTNEIDGKYQITFRDEAKYSAKTKDLTVYRILLKDGKFKITADVKSELAYSFVGVNQDMAVNIMTMPKLMIAIWAAKMIEGPTNDFDF